MRWPWGIQQVPTTQKGPFCPRSGPQLSYQSFGKWSRSSCPLLFMLWNIFFVQKNDFSDPVDYLRQNGNHPICVAGPASSRLGKNQLRQLSGDSCEKWKKCQLEKMPLYPLNGPGWTLQSLVVSLLGFIFFSSFSWPLCIKIILIIASISNNTRIHIILLNNNI